MHPGLLPDEMSNLEKNCTIEFDLNHPLSKQPQKVSHYSDEEITDQNHEHQAAITDDIDKGLSMKAHSARESESNSKEFLLGCNALRDYFQE